MIAARRRPAAPPCVQRGLHEFPRAPHLVTSLRGALEGVAGRKLSYHVYGGFARACITGEPFSDVDVAAATGDDRNVLRSLRGRPFQLRDARGQLLTVRLDVRRQVVRSPAALVAGIEFVLARLAFSTTDDCFHMDPECLEALAARVLSLRPVASPLVTPARTIGRTFKYAARGARLPLETLLSAIDDHRATPAIVRWGERHLRGLLRPRELVTGGRP